MFNTRCSLCRTLNLFFKPGVRKKIRIQEKGMNGKSQQSNTRQYAYTSDSPGFRQGHQRGNKVGEKNKMSMEQRIGRQGHIYDKKPQNRYNPSTPNKYGLPANEHPMKNFHPEQPMQSISQQQQTSVVIMEQPQVGNTIAGKAPEEFIISAICVTLFCIPMGVAAIVSAIYAKKYAGLLDFDKALVWEYRAKIIIRIGVICILVWCLIIIILVTLFKLIY